MSEIELQFADDENGDPVTVPASTVSLRVMRHRQGQAGAPARVHVENKLFTVAPDAGPDALSILPEDSYRLQPLNAKGKYVGKAFYVEIVKLGAPVNDEEPTPEVQSTVDADRERFYSEMRHEMQELRALVRDVMVGLKHSADKALDTQSELTNAVAKIVDAAASMIGAARGPTHAQVASELRDILENPPANNGSNLETVLNSPIVVGAAAGLQKYMAEAAKTGAEVMAGAQHGQNGESGAQRAARIAAQANNPRS